MATTTISAPTMASRARATTRPCARCATRQRPQPAGHAAAVPGHADAADGRRAGPQPAGQQQRLLPGQRAELAGLAGRHRRGSRLRRGRGKAGGVAPDASSAAAAPLSPRRTGDGGSARCDLAGAGGPSHDPGGLAGTATPMLRTDAGGRGCHAGGPAQCGRVAAPVRAATVRWPGRLAHPPRYGRSDRRGCRSQFGVAGGPEF